jgi:hypothetical protein
MEDSGSFPKKPWEFTDLLQPLGNIGATSPKNPRQSPLPIERSGKIGLLLGHRNIDLGPVQKRETQRVDRHDGPGVWQVKDIFAKKNLHHVLFFSN